MHRLEDFIPPEIDPGAPVGFGSSAMAGMEGFAALFGLFFVGVVVFSIVVGVRKYRVLKDAGVDPLTVDAALAAKVLSSDALAPREPRAPEPTIESRLAEVDALFARGVISADEHREARSAILRG